MAIIINNEKYLSYEEQVEKNKEDIKELQLESSGFKEVDMDTYLNFISTGYIRWNKEFRYKIIRLHLKIKDQMVTDTGYFGLYGLPVYYEINYTYSSTFTAYNKDGDTIIVARYTSQQGQPDILNNKLEFKVTTSNSIDKIRNDDYFIYVIDTGYSLYVTKKNP